MFRVTLNDAGQKVCSRVHIREELLQILDSPANKAAFRDAMAGNEKRKKQQVQIAAQCNPERNGGLLAACKPHVTSHLMLDVDYDLSQPGWQDQMERDTQRIMQLKEQAGVLFLQRTRKGLHIIMRRPDPTVCQSENLRMAAEKLGVVPDPLAKDITRVFFCGDSSTLLYLHDAVFAVEDCPYVPEPEEAIPHKPAAKQTAQAATHTSREHLSTDGRPRYKGLTFNWPEIISKYWQQNGGEPTKGNRNAGTLELAQQLSYFTADEQILDQAIPPL